MGEHFQHNEGDGCNGATVADRRNANDAEFQGDLGNVPLGSSRPARTRSRRGTKPKTKRAQLIALLSRKTGKDISAISDQLGWQPHTTRAALSRLRKAGFEITREVPKRGRAARYRIIAEPAVEAGQ